MIQKNIVLMVGKLSSAFCTFWKQSRFFLVATGLCLTLLPAQGQVLITQLQGLTDNGGTAVSLTTFGVNAGSNSVLLLAVSAENLGTSIPTLTVNGNATTTLATVTAPSGLATQTSIFAYALGTVAPSTTVNLQLTNVNGNGGYAIYQLTGAQQTFTLNDTYWAATAANNNSLSVSTTLTGVAAGSALVSFAGTEVAEPFSSSDYGSNFSALGDVGSFGVATGFLSNQSGNITVGMTRTGQTGSTRENVFATVAIAPVTVIPEPSTVMLFGFGVLGLLLVRRFRSSEASKRV